MDKIGRIGIHFLGNHKEMEKEPKLEDYYDTFDPRGCSTSEYNEYLKALEEFKNKKEKTNE